MCDPSTEVRITLAPRAAIGGSVVGEGRLTTRLRVSVGRGEEEVKIKKTWEKIDIFFKKLRKNSTDKGNSKSTQKIQVAKYTIPAFKEENKR